METLLKVLRPFAIVAMHSACEITIRGAGSDYERETLAPLNVIASDPFLTGWHRVADAHWPNWNAHYVREDGSVYPA
jgi:hypothetical protein